MARASDDDWHGIFARLIEDHRRLTAMMEQIESTAYDPAFDREGLFEGLEKELLVHSAAEDEVLYTTVELYASTASAILVAREQHALIDHVLHELAQTSIDDERWMARFEVLEQLIEKHIHEEEGDIFDLASDLIGPARAEDLVEEYEEARAREASRVARRGAVRTQRDDRMLRDFGDA